MNKSKKSAIEELIGGKTKSNSIIATTINLSEESFSLLKQMQIIMMQRTNGQYSYGKVCEEGLKLLAKELKIDVPQ